MGKPFNSELYQLEETYRATLSMDISSLNAAVSNFSRYPLVAIGSGGSLSAAYFACHLHQQASGFMAKPATPLEVLSLLDDHDSRLSLVSSSVLCLTAGGSNSDINHVWRSLIEVEPRYLTAVCARTRSPLAKVGAKYDSARVFDFDLPSKKDGFLATNSLLAFLVLIGRSYGQLMNTTQVLPSSLWDLIPGYDCLDAALDSLRATCLALFERNNLIVLYGAGTESAACDVESKFTEAALGSVQISDFRNFAHGRHHWLAKRGKQTAIIAFADDRDIEIARKTVQLIPSSVPSAIFHFPGNPVSSAVSALLIGFFLTGIAGEIKGIDPGRPGVPQFGRRLYHLTIGPRGKTAPEEKPGIRRKSFVCPMPSSELMKAHNIFCQSLTETNFSGLVLDYDGTLCSPENRFGDLDTQITKELVQLLDLCIPVGIATGRGKSVRQSLQHALPILLRERVIVGYYNGAECATLSDNRTPDGTNIVCEELEPIARAFLSSPTIALLATITVRKRQISVEPARSRHFDILWGIVGEHIARFQGIKMVHSAHSIDVLAPGVSKRNVVDVIKASFVKSQKSSVLCIGDQGRWPGNDSELLLEANSLSVDTVSSDLNTCWNIAPAGYRGQQATLYYLKRLVPKDGLFRFKLVRSRKA